MKATFENSVNVLVKAFINDTLVARNCFACAVGNLVASANNYGFKNFECYPKLRWSNVGTDYYPGEPTCKNIGGWGAVFTTDWNDDGDKKEQKVNTKFYTGEAKRQIESTGYTLRQLAKIELAFEKGFYSELNEVDVEINDDVSEGSMFNGLMALVDILAQIHNVDLSVKESAKLLFVKL